MRVLKLSESILKNQSLATHRKFAKNRAFKQDEIQKDGSLKVNKYVPGTNIKIVKESEFSKIYKDKKVLLNLAWHISDEIRYYVKNKLKFKNKVIDIIHKKDFK